MYDEECYDFTYCVALPLLVLAAHSWHFVLSKELYYHPKQSMIQHALISTLSSGSMDVTIEVRRVLGKAEDRTRLHPQQRPQSRHSVNTEQCLHYIQLAKQISPPSRSTGRAPSAQSRDSGSRGCLAFSF